MTRVRGLGKMTRVARGLRKMVVRGRVKVKRHASLLPRRERARFDRDEARRLLLLLRRRLRTSPQVASPNAAAQCAE
jgi:hypothetical protein